MEFGKEKSNVLHMSRTKPFVITAVNTQTKIGILLKRTWAQWVDIAFSRSQEHSHCEERVVHICIQYEEHGQETESGFYSHQCRGSYTWRSVQPWTSQIQETCHKTTGSKV